MTIMYYNQFTNKISESGDIDTIKEFDNPQSKFTPDQLDTMYIEVEITEEMKGDMFHIVGTDNNGNKYNGIIPARDYFEGKNIEVYEITKAGQKTNVVPMFK